jgi:hypothetical protein
MTATTYTVLDGRGELIDGPGLTAAEAAHRLLTDDSREYEIRQDADGSYWLWDRQQVANRPWSRYPIGSYAETREEAEAEIFAEVISRWGRDGRGPEAISDEQYAALIAAGEE